MTNSPTDQVLVVGAGPVGLVTAHELARRKVAVRVVDAADGPATTSRAIATHARTLETYDQMGVVDRVKYQVREAQVAARAEAEAKEAEMLAEYEATRHGVKTE